MRIRRKAEIPQIKRSQSNFGNCYYLFGWNWVFVASGRKNYISPEEILCILVKSCSEIIENSFLLNETRFLNFENERNFERKNVIAIYINI